MATELRGRPELSPAVNTVLRPSGPHVWHRSHHEQMEYDVGEFTSCAGVRQNRAALNSRHFLFCRGSPVRDGTPSQTDEEMKFAVCVCFSWWK